MPIHRRAMLQTSLAGLGAWAAANSWTTARADEPKAAGRLLVHSNPDFPILEKAGFGFLGFVLVNPEDATWRRLTDRRVHAVARLSPDGQRVALVSSSESGSKVQLLVCDIEGAEAPKAVAEFECVTIAPVWSADGKAFVLTVSKRSKDRIPTVEVFRMAADGTGVEALPFPDLPYVNDWSPDGQHFLVHLHARDADQPRNDRNRSLALLRPDGSIVRRLTEKSSNCARFSPDGRRVLYVEALDNGNALWVEPVEGGERRRIPVDELHLILACWSPDGKSIALSADKMRPGPGSDLLFPRDEPVVSELTIVEADGDGRRTLPIPGGFLRLNDWR